MSSNNLNYTTTKVQKKLGCALLRSGIR